MKHLSIILIALGLSLSSFAGQPKDTASTVVPFNHRAGCNLIVVSVTLNGIETSFLVDCGSEVSVLATSQAEVFRYNIVEGDDTQNTDWSGKPVNLSYASSAVVKLGNITLKNCFRAADLDALLATVSKRTGKNVVGIIGSDILARYGLVIDFKNQCIHQ
jgi:hypothetical protein